MYLKYLKSLMRHKWFVFLAGLKTGVPIWRLIVHDWSKFLPIEFVNYAQWHGGIEDRGRWALAWGHHQNHNPHHPEYWIINWRGSPDFYDDVGHRVNRFTTILPMPETYVREMVADLMGASKTFTGSWDMTDWLRQNQAQITKMMHRQTVIEFSRVLEEQGYEL